jgi:hypothetical protein
MANYDNVPPTNASSPFVSPTPAEYPEHGYEGLHGGTCEWRTESSYEKCGRVKGDKRHVGYAPQYMTTSPPPATILVVNPERDQNWPGSALAVWQGHADAVLALLKQKQAYGNSWQTQGYMGNIGRILSKSDRLRNMMWGDYYGTKENPTAEGNPEAESVLDTLYDLSALCAFAIANLEEGNRWGS